ncbi:hypothetical protein CTI12_AA259530 [Artemisia annua]|uniref:Uncharacterized protein n=1 Tax=Artemisia annua TaxID=35608 RepID=A0A2U1NIW0_ARTAN|nr:hypothetical protein CTI12_AA259530 [Artemisia annua]
MESSDFIDTVKAEKMHAIAQYNLFTNFRKFVQVVEFFVLIAIISWLSSRVPIIFKFSSEHIFTFSSYVMNQHVVFLVSNVIVILCYVQGRPGGGANPIPAQGTFSNGAQIFGNFLNCEELINQFAMKNARRTSRTIGAFFSWLALGTQILRAATGYVLSRDHSDAGNVISGECTDAPVVNSSMMSPENVSPVTVEVKAIKKAVKQIERFKRTQSEKLKSEIATKPRRELRRSVTEKRRSVVKTGSDDVVKVTSSKNDVEQLSNEEFRIAIEAFISKQQTLIKQQSLVEFQN